MMQLLPRGVTAASRLLIQAPRTLTAASAPVIKARVLISFVLLAFANGVTEGKQCACLPYWECIVTGGAAIGYCDQVTSNVCCSFGNDDNNSVTDQIFKPEKALNEPQNDLEQERPATEAPQLTANPHHPPILSTSASPPPPVRLFGDQITRPVISSALARSVPVKRLVTQVSQVGDFDEDRSKLDAFPAGVTIRPGTNRVPTRLVSSTMSPPNILLNNHIIVRRRQFSDGLKGSDPTIGPLYEVVTTSGGQHVLLRLSRPPIRRLQPVGETVELPQGRHILKIVQTPGEITQLSLQSIPTQEPDTQQAATSREEGNSTAPQIKSRKTFSFRPHRAPSSQQLSAHERNTDHEETATPELPPAVRQGSPGREVTLPFKPSQTMLGSRVSRARVFAFSESSQPVPSSGDRLEFVEKPRFSFRDTKQRGN
ncbi:uncharacterized protein LOC111272611 isoform X1 [Varroa jacobsoni]|uniref:uncharacterized protein LOC111272611 isoform X1 n=1 Tax=Varroa jacobsoni TaxID=62625 RepID=UPI000BF76EB3|nr:uncharacterized protein LOC111272611 isoform X1 [Varroa jacobsoni]XP_022709907.1 uncharacterized protein LOC111272611 isoform X1 [Varroa jacobsoni]XP_022709908.1 uncharacterized protein LOC111272611 isoform X1 [Varroa jacobsoni]